MTELNNLICKKHLASAVGTLTYILVGPLLWAIQLTTVYGGHTLVCTDGIPNGLGRLLVLAASIAVAFRQDARPSHL